ncbi:MAG: hypothetical protein QNJ74_29660, partial [Trichodesmium sp. MO_231.B1]|nr:hypothetical protein [Trichodesmium sp. MO_231.B1]
SGAFRQDGMARSPFPPGRYAFCSATCKVKLCEAQTLASNLPREEIVFPCIQFPNGFNLLVIIHYPLSIIH